MRIETERLILREFASDDWPAVLAYQRDSRYLRLYPWTEPRNPRFEISCGSSLTSRRSSRGASFSLLSRFLMAGS